MPAEDSSKTSQQLLIYVEKTVYLLLTFTTCRGPCKLHTNHQNMHTECRSHWILVNDAEWAEWRLLISFSGVVFIDSNGAISSMAAYLVFHYSQLVIPHWTASMYSPNVLCVLYSTPNE